MSHCTDCAILLSRALAAEKERDAALSRVAEVERVRRCQYEPTECAGGDGEEASAEPAFCAACWDREQRHFADELDAARAEIEAKWSATAIFQRQRDDAITDRDALREVVERTEPFIHEVVRNYGPPDARRLLADIRARLDARDATAQDKTPGGADRQQATDYREAPLRDVGKPAVDAPVGPSDAQEATLPKPAPTGGLSPEPGQVRCESCDMFTHDDPPDDWRYDTEDGVWLCGDCVRRLKAEQQVGLSPEQRAEVEAIVREVVASDCERGDIMVPWPYPLTRLAGVMREELRKGAK